MRVGLVTDGIYPFVVGGMQKHSYYLAYYLAKNNIGVDLYHFVEHNSDKTKKDVFGEFSSNVELITVPFPRKKRLPLHYIRESKEYSKKLYEAFSRRPSVDLLICKGFAGWEFVKRKKNGEKLPALGINFHGYEMFQKSFSFRDKLIQQALQPPVAFISRNADYVFSYGGKITDLIRNIVKVPEEKIIEFPAGIEDHWLAKNVSMPGEKLRFVFVGRYEPRKGLKELTACIKNFRKDRKWQFDFIGNIPSNVRLHHENVKYHGLITDSEQTKKILSSADILVCPSWSEGMPNVILEGMASGLAVLSTDTGATRLLVNERTGWMIDEPRVHCLDAIFSEIFETPKEIIYKKKISALEHIRAHFLWDDLAVGFVNTIKKMVYGK